MSTIQLSAKDSAKAVAAPTQDKSWGWEWLAMGIVSLISACLLAAWFTCSHRLPTIDEAGHILNSLTYRDLFRHPHLFNQNWWFQLFTVNRFYPPFVHAFGGALKAFLGTGRAVDVFALIVYNVVLTCSVFGAAKICSGRMRAAIFAAIIINCYPIIALLNRAFWLDLPLVAMISMALYAVLRYDSAKTWKNALFAGVCLGLAGMTKQIAVAYLALPTIYILGNQLIGGKKAQPHVSRTTVAQALSICLIAGAICAPWLLLNAGQAKNIADECSAHITKSQSYWANLAFYMVQLPTIMSPLLLAILPSAFLTVPRTALTKLVPVGLSVLGGLLSISAVAFLFPKPQYEAPILIASAIVSGIVLCRIADSSSRLLPAFAYAYLAAAVTQILAMEFAPYPVHYPAFLSKIPSSMKAEISEPRLGFVGLNPHNTQDWGQVWAIEQIDKIDSGKQVWLNILGNTPNLNVHTFELVARDLNSKVKPTTSRLYSIGGDTVHFSPEEALYYQWYLVPSENKYQGFANAESEQQFQRLKEFISDSDHFRAVASKVLPDGSSVTLYRQL